MLDKPNAPRIMQAIFHWETQNKKCYYCEKSLVKDLEPIDTEGTMGAYFIELEDFNTDHKIPVSKGGQSSLLNTCISCVGCNTLKGNMDEQTFRHVMSFVKSGKLAPKDFNDFVKYRQLHQKFSALGVTPEGEVKWAEKVI